MDPPPPSYDQATSSNPNSSSIPHVTRNGIPPQSRRSMEDESRDLPRGWVRQYDTKEHHQFFVDTNSNPPRSIWQHPYDDPTFMNSLAPEERGRIKGLQRVPTEEDMAAESSDDDEATYHGQTQELPRRNTPPPTGIFKLGRRMKDSLTNSTHQERQANRVRRADEERRTYERYQGYRAAMSRAAETGEPQLLGRDRSGREVYIEPPHGPRQNWGGYGGGSYGYNPYSQGPYGMPNSRYMRPMTPYNRPYYGGYGGGLGLPMGMGLPIGLGLGGGLLAGGMMF